MNNCCTVVTQRLPKLAIRSHKSKDIVL